MPGLDRPTDFAGAAPQWSESGRRLRNEDGISTGRFRRPLQGPPPQLRRPTTGGFRKLPARRTGMARVWWVVLWLPVRPPPCVTPTTGPVLRGKRRRNRPFRAATRGPEV